MSDKIPNVVSLTGGLDISSPSMLVKPGTLVDCLNYECVDLVGYSRIDGFQPYDGSISLKDIEGIKVYTATISNTSASPTINRTNVFYSPAVGGGDEPIGFMFSCVAATNTIVFIPFDGNPLARGKIAAWTFGVLQDATLQETTITNAQLLALEAALRNTAIPAVGTPVGLHWHRNNLHAAIPLVALSYELSDATATVTFSPGGTITSSQSGAGNFIVLDKIVTTPSNGTTQPELGYFLVQWDGTGVYQATSSATLGGAGITVSTGTCAHSPRDIPTSVMPDEFNQTIQYSRLRYGSLGGTRSFASHMYKATRAYLHEDPSTVTAGWVPLDYTYYARATLDFSGASATETPNMLSLRRGNQQDPMKFRITNSATQSNEVVIADYYVVSGDLYDGTTADVILQFYVPGGFPNFMDATSEVEVVDDSGLNTWFKVGDLTTDMKLVFLPGYQTALPYKGLNYAHSRYQMISSNFFADAERDAMYGVSGAGRAFVCDSTTYSHIYTQEDAEKDMPRHIAFHHLHLALGFASGSVQISVVGEPTNYSGVDGASDIGVGDTVTGLMPLSGVSLGVFCESSIWKIDGQTVDNFNTQVISPNTGAIEYTLADCGQPVYMDARGLSTLETSANYGDFMGFRLSAPVSPWLLPRCNTPKSGDTFNIGIACVIPIRKKNQYRVFFNDGHILTATFLPGGERQVAFTRQRYDLSATSLDGDTFKRLVPLAWTSQVDLEGRERVYVSHYSSASTVTSNHAYALDSGTSFAGTYIPHYFVTNWYYGEAPQQFMQIQSVRLHGTSRGKASLSMRVKGAQNDMYFAQDTFSSAVPLSLPRNDPGFITDIYHEATNITDINGRGLSVQLKLEGSGSLTVPEPSHAAQVLIVYSAPEGAYDN